MRPYAAAAADFGFLLLTLPPRPDCAGLMGAFTAAQAAWAVLLLLRVVSRWPGAAGKSGRAGPAIRHRFSRADYRAEDSPWVRNLP